MSDAPKKPGDHPDFFRLPPPAGRSRESSIRLDEAGRFWHDGEHVSHQGMARAFRSWIARHPDDGRPILQNGYDWCYFQLDGVPFEVSTLRTEVNPTRVLLSDGSEEVLLVDTLRVDAGGRLSVSVRGGDFDAQFSAQAQASLGELLEQGPDGDFWLRLPEGRFPIRGAA
jgi:hypothetical protein